MSFHQDEEEAGPSGVPVEEMRTLLGLNNSEPNAEDKDDQQ